MKRPDRGSEDLCRRSTSSTAKVRKRQRVRLVTSRSNEGGVHRGTVTGLTEGKEEAAETTRLHTVTVVCILYPKRHERTLNQPRERRT